MSGLHTIHSRTVVLPGENIDTDQIIPARFLLVTTRAGLGEGLFADWRYDAQGRPRPEFPLNRPDAEGARILVAGRNFGCGSSREHAAWALAQAGFQAVISSSFADIFRGNALKNGLVPVQLSEAAHAQLLAQPGAPVTVELTSLQVRLPDGGLSAFALDPFARHCLMEGLDELGFLLSRESAIWAFETARSHATR